MCKILSVHRSCYYEWLKTSDKKIVSIKEHKLESQVKASFIESKQNYGTRRIKKDLADNHELVISRRKVKKIMNKLNLFCKTRKKYKTTTDSNHSYHISPNILNREFKVSEPNKCWVGDITYIPTKTGWAYLSVVIDLYSRKVISWSIDDNMRSELVNKSLLQAIWRRKPKAGLVWHSDQGVQYASKKHRDIIKYYKIKQSMSRRGNCWDNAVAESFFKTLKSEIVNKTVFKDISHAKSCIFEYIESFYNRKRIHSAIDYMTPHKFKIISKTCPVFC